MPARNDKAGMPFFQIILDLLRWRPLVGKKLFFRLTSLNFSSNIPDFDCKICLASRKNGIFPRSKPPPQQVYYHQPETSSIVPPTVFSILFLILVAKFVNLSMALFGFKLAPNSVSISLRAASTRAL